MTPKRYSNGWLAGDSSPLSHCVAVENDMLCASNKKQILVRQSIPIPLIIMRTHVRLSHMKRFASACSLAGAETHETQLCAGSVSFLRIDLKIVDPVRSSREASRQSSSFLTDLSSLAHFPL